MDRNFAATLARRDPCLYLGSTKMPSYSMGRKSRPFRRPVESPPPQMMRSSRGHQRSRSLASPLLVHVAYNSTVFLVSAWIGA